MSSSLEEKVNGRLLANVHGRWTRGHSAMWLLSVPVRQTFRFAGRAGILIDLSNRQTAEFPGKARIRYKHSLIKSLDENVNGRLPTDVHIRWTRDHSAMWLRSLYPLGKLSGSLVELI